jgi:hypothetical protein
VGLSVLSAMILESRDDIYYTSTELNGKFGLIISLGAEDRYRPIISFPPHWSSPKEACDAGVKYVEGVRDYVRSGGIERELAESGTAWNGEVVDPGVLERGDRFLFFQNEGTELTRDVHVHDGWEDGWEYHVAATGEKMNGIGEVPVVKLRSPTYSPREKAEALRTSTGSASLSLSKAVADDYIRLHAAALDLCRKLQAPLMEYLRADVQDAWTALFDIVEDRR